MTGVWGIQHIKRTFHCPHFIFLFFFSSVFFFGIEFFFLPCISVINIFFLRFVYAVLLVYTYGRVDLFFSYFIFHVTRFFFFTFLFWDFFFPRWENCWHLTCLGMREFFLCNDFWFKFLWLGRWVETWE